MRGSLPWLSPGILKSVARSEVDRSAPAFDQTRAELLTISMISVGPTAICVSGGVALPFRRPSIDDPELINGVPAAFAATAIEAPFAAAEAWPDLKWLGATAGACAAPADATSAGCSPRRVL